METAIVNFNVYKLENLGMRLGYSYVHNMPNYFALPDDAALTFSASA